MYTTQRAITFYFGDLIGEDSICFGASRSPPPIQEQVANMMREHAVETTMWEAPEQIPCEDEDEDVDGDGDGGDGDGVSQSDDE
ncbi:hypothetical protein Tco_1451069 [Tanacetum coccineum]